MKQMLFCFLLAGIFLCSCGGGQGTQNKSNTDTVKTKTFRTVQKLDSIAKGDTVLINLNGKTYKVAGIESGPDDENVPQAGDTKLTATAPNKACDSESFDGIDRKAAKISLSPGAAKTYSTLADFIVSLPSDSDMGALNIPTGATSNRVKQERHNVHILKAYIYTFTRETDEDYHVILGTTDQAGTARFFNMEISGLPAHSASSYAKLKAVRDTFTGFFKISGCLHGYVPVFIPPVEVEVSGSIFFDALHYTHHTPIGPAGYHPQSYWEIHPATAILSK